MVRLVGALETSAPPGSAPTEQVGCVGMAGMPYPPTSAPPEGSGDGEGM